MIYGCIEAGFKIEAQDLSMDLLCNYLSYATKQKEKAVKGGSGKTIGLNDLPEGGA